MNIAPLVAAVVAMGFAISAAPAGAAGGDAPLTFEGALALARSAAPAVGTAEAHALVARLNVDRVGTARWPTLSAALSTSVGVQNSHAIAGTDAQVCDPALAICADARAYANLSGSAGLEARWTLFDFGRTSASEGAAKEGADAAAFDVETVRDSAAREAALGFLSVAAHEELLELRSEILASRQRALEVAQGRVRLGSAPMIDETRAAVSLETARAERARTEAGLNDARAALAKAIGVDVTTPIVIDRGASLAVQEEDPRRAAETAESTRAEVNAAKRRIAQSELALALARAQRWPTLSAVANANAKTSGATTQNVLNATETANLGATISIPLFDLALGANITSAQASVSVERAAAEERVQSVRAQAAQAAIAVRSQREALKATEALRRQADAGLEQAEGRYQSGAGSILELIDAQTEQASAAVSVVSARLQLASAQAALLASIGTLGGNG